MRWDRVSITASKTAGSSEPAGSGNGPVEPAASAGNFFVGAVADGDDDWREAANFVEMSWRAGRGGQAGAAAAAAAAPELMASAGWVPALRAKRPGAAAPRGRRRASSGRSCGSRRRGPTAGSCSGGAQMPCSVSGTRRTYRRLASPAETMRSTIPASARTERWWARRFVGISSHSASSPGERSDAASSSTMRRRVGSPRAA